MRQTERPVFGHALGSASNECIASVTLFSLKYQSVWLIYSAERVIERPVLYVFHIYGFSVVIMAYLQSRKVCKEKLFLLMLKSIREVKQVYPFHLFHLLFSM